MKNLIIIILSCFLCIQVSANEQIPKYKIIANSNQHNDILKMYEIKNNLVSDYKIWTKSIDDKQQALYDHLEEYNATYENNIFLIVIGEGKGKELTGQLKNNYCETTKDIKKRSFIFDFLFK